MSRPARLALLIAAIVVAVDQVTKSVAVDRLDGGPVDLFWTLRLNLSYNSGLAFSLGPGLTPWIIAVVVALVAGLLVATHRATSALVAAGLGFLLGGAVGNLCDRVFRGHDGAVVDFIDLQWWPVFNVADIGVTAGAILLIVATLREREPETDA